MTLQQCLRLSGLMPLCSAPVVRCARGHSSQEQLQAMAEQQHHMTGQLTQRDAQVRCKERAWCLALTHA